MDARIPQLLQERFKLQEAYGGGPSLGLSCSTSGPTTKNQIIPPGLFGRPTETEVVLYGRTVKTLLDTGSTVSTISHSYYSTYMSEVELQNLDTILDIECAGGQQLPYDGFISTEIRIPHQDNTFPCILLVIPDSSYNTHVPLLLGTNILQPIMDNLKHQHGERFLQSCNLSTPWYLTFRSITLREKELIRNKNILAIVKNAATKPVTIKPNTSTQITGYLDKELPYSTTTAMLHSSVLQPNWKDLEIEPGLIQYTYGGNGIINVQIANVTTRTITIPPRAVLCEVQPVTIEHQEQNTTSTLRSTSVLDQVEITKSNLTEHQLQTGISLIKSYEDIFAKDDVDIGCTKVKHRIDLLDEKPFKQRYRRIPPAMYDEVKEHLRQLLTAGTIRPSHSPWASNVVLVRKKNGKLRLCVDYRQLNLSTKKDSYSLPRIEELLDCLSSSNFFSTIDVKSGYHHIEILEEHKERTAFTVGPLGFYEYNRMPFGLTNSPATYQRMMEECLSDLHLKICCIFIDDVIIFGKTYDEHLENLQLVFERLRQDNLKLAPDKCSFFKRKVTYVGHVVSEQGVEIDPEKTARKGQDDVADPRQVLLVWDGQRRGELDTSVWQMYKEKDTSYKPESTLGQHRDTVSSTTCLFGLPHSGAI